MTRWPSGAELHGLTEDEVTELHDSWRGSARRFRAHTEPLARMDGRDDFGDGVHLIRDCPACHTSMMYAKRTPRALVIRAWWVIDGLLRRIREAAA